MKSEKIDIPPSVKDSLIKESPVPVIIFSKDLVCINHSDLFRQIFNLDQSYYGGRHISEIIPHIPNKLKTYIENGLKGKTGSNDAEKFSSKKLAHQWYRWNVKPWKNNEGEIGGVIVVLEDITDKKRAEELLLSALRVARIGGWEVDLIANKIHWTEITREIHEVPKDFEPDLATGINFYKAGYSRDTISDSPLARTQISFLV